MSVLLISLGIFAVRMPHATTTSAWIQMWCSPTDRHWSSSSSRTGNHMVAGLTTTLEHIQGASLVVVVIVEPLKVAKPQEHYSRVNDSLKISRPGFLFFAWPHGNSETVYYANPEMPLCIIQKTNMQTLVPFCSSWFWRNLPINWMSLWQWHGIVTCWKHAIYKPLSRIFKDSMRILSRDWSKGRKIPIYLSHENFALVYHSASICIPINHRCDLWLNYFKSAQFIS